MSSPSIAPIFFSTLRSISFCFVKNRLIRFCKSIRNYEFIGLDARILSDYSTILAKNIFIIMKNKKAIIWDWNGTLLDDIELCINSMNSLLSDRKLRLLDKISYREIFTFPVKEYYEKAGFNFSLEPYEVPAMQFIALYYSHLDVVNLFPEVKKVLQFFHRKGYNQSILSAMEHEKLMSSLKEKGIIHFFENITGIDDHYAHSKVEIGKDLIRKIPFSKPEIVMVGDTLHDLEVANELGVDCVLIANGHQSKERLLGNNAIVINNLEDIFSVL